MLKKTFWMCLSFLWFATLLAFNACSNDSNENTLPLSSSEAQASSSSSKVQTSSSSSETKISSSSSETQTSSSSLEAQTSSSSSETQIFSSSSKIQTSSSSLVAQILSSSSKAVVSSSSEATSGTFIDRRNSNVIEYKWVKIGEQVWMAQNLNYSVAPVLGGGDPPCYNENTRYCDTYGRLYGPTAKTACPVDWRLPTKTEWQTLVDFIGEDAGKKLKAKSGWDSGNGTDEYGFAALPGGQLRPATGFQDIGTTGYWWSSDEEDDERGYVWSIGSGNGASLYGGGLNPQFVQRYYSIRCIKN